MLLEAKRSVHTRENFLCPWLSAGNYDDAGTTISSITHWEAPEKEEQAFREAWILFAALWAWAGPKGRDKSRSGLYTFLTLSLNLASAPPHSWFPFYLTTPQTLFSFPLLFLKSQSHAPPPTFPQKAWGQEQGINGEFSSPHSVSSGFHQKLDVVLFSFHFLWTLNPPPTSVSNPDSSKAGTFSH